MVSNPTILGRKRPNGGLKRPATSPNIGVPPVGAPVLYRRISLPQWPRRDATSRFPPDLGLVAGVCACAAAITGGATTPPFVFTSTRARTPGNPNPSPRVAPAYTWWILMVAGMVTGTTLLHCCAFYWWHLPGATGGGQCLFSQCNQGRT
jgi:hypothetical protein